MIMFIIQVLGNDIPIGHASTYNIKLKLDFKCKAKWYKVKKWYKKQVFRFYLWNIWMKGNTKPWRDLLWVVIPNFKINMANAHVSTMTF
jgi:hypothetical protein